MRRMLSIVWISLLVMPAFSQEQEVQQLLLNVEKLRQFKQILSDMKKGYDVLHKGYTAIREISRGNFDLHKTFLDALFEVSPAVRKYKRVGDIIRYQVAIVKEGKAALKQFRTDGKFNPDELGYMEKVYSGLLKRSLKSMDELSMVITAGKLRMSDEERLEAIDKVYDSVLDQYSFLQEFSNQTSVLSLQRKREVADVELLRRLLLY